MRDVATLRDLLAKTEPGEAVRLTEGLASS